MRLLVLNSLLFLFSCLPAFLFRPFPIKRFAWCFVLCAPLSAFLFQPFPRFSFFFYALLLGLFLFLSIYRVIESGKLSGFLLCWSGGLTVLSSGHLLHAVASTGAAAWFLLLFSLFEGIVFGFAARLLFQRGSEDMVQLTEDHKVSPLPLLFIISAFLFLLTLFGAELPIGCIPISIVLHSLLLMILSLWDNMSLAVRHSKESSEHSQKSVHLIDHASRSSEATLLRQLTESNNKLHQVSLAYQNGDKATLSSLLELPDTQGSSYSPHLLLDAILRSSARKARDAGLLPNFQLQLGSMENFFLPDIGVLVNLMLELMSERHPGDPDTLRLRMQEWGNALIVVVGRRDSLNSVPENKMNALLQLTEEYHGWLELAEKDRGIRLSVVLFRPISEKQPTLQPVK